ncbi:ndbB, partial [Symbiodinium necroappetens]
MAEERKTRLEQIQAVFAGLGAGTRSLLEDRSKMTVLVGGLTALALGVYGARAATGVAGNLIERCQAVRHHRPFTVTRAFTRTAVPSLLQSTIKTSAMACFTAPSASILSAPLCARVQSKTPEGLLAYQAGDVSRRSYGAARNLLAGGAAAFAGAAALCSSARGRQLYSKRAASRKQIVVVGGGLAGLNLALRLDQMPWKSRPEVKLLDPKDRYVFLPLLIDYATGVVELEEFAPTYRELLQDASSVQHLQGSASEVDWRRRQVSFSLAQAQDEPQSLSFDALVIASGGVGQSDFVSLPGLAEALESGKALRFSSLADADALRRRLHSVESVAIVGAGYVGVELAAGLAEVLPEAAAAGRIALFGSRFLPGCEEANQKKSAEVLDKLGILRKTGRVVSIDAEGVAWSPTGTERSELHSCSLVIVTGALATSVEERLKLASSVDEESIDKGRAVVDSYLRIAPGLFCLGDASGGSPPTGQIAMQQAETTAWNIFAQLSHLPRPTWRRFKPNAMGEFIALGSTEAAGVVQPTQLGNLLPPALPPAIARAVAPTVSSVGQASTAKAAVAGRPASLLRRLAYLYRLPGMHRLKVAQQRLMRPPLVRETSRLTWGRDGLKSLISSKKQGGFLEKIVLEDELTERLQWTTNSLVNAKKNGTPYRHLLLHGPPGTGKTLFARTLARQSGLDYAIMSGGDVGPLGKDALQKESEMPGTIHDPIGGQSRATIAAKQAKPMEEFAERTKREAEERKKQRTAEGGRGGGYNDRQEVERRQPPREDDCAYDDFGRKKNDKSQLSKADRAAAALKRLQVHELNKLFSWANSSRRGLILFIDEADAFLRTGRGSDTGSMSEEARNVLSAFLHHTGTESDKFVVVLATNIREILDRAVLDRVDENFEFPLPSLEERKRMLAMFMEEHIHTPTKRGKVIEVDAALDESFLDQAWTPPSSKEGAGKMAGIDMDNPHLDPVETFSFLRLVSADGHEFFLDRRIAYECDTFKKMVEKEGFKEGQTNEIQLPTVTGKLLEKVIEYLYFKYKYTDAKVPIPEFPIDDDVVL